jgi:hypothetical protein
MRRLTSLKKPREGSAPFILEGNWNTERVSSDGDIYEAKREGVEWRMIGASLVAIYRESIGRLRWRWRWVDGGIRAHRIQQSHLK